MEFLSGEKLKNAIVEKAEMASKCMYICSPYIGSRSAVNDILGKRWDSNSLRFKLLADFSDVQNINKDTLNYLLDNLFNKIKSLPQLHGKIYIFDDEAFLTSANLTGTSFTSRYEFGILFGKSEYMGVKKIFDEYWNQATVPSKKLLKLENKKRKSSDSRDERKGRTPLKKLWSIRPDVDNKETASNYWIKVIGRPNVRAPFGYDLKKELNKGYTTFGKRPMGFKKNDIVYLGILSEGREGNSDMTIYGKAKIRIPFREKIDDISKYVNRKNQIKDKYDKVDALYELGRWRYGIWMKDIIILKSKLKNAIWNSKFKNKNGENYISKFSFRNGYKKLTKQEAEILDRELQKKINKFGSYPPKTPNNFWFNHYLTPHAHNELVNKLKINNI